MVEKIIVLLYWFNQRRARKMTSTLSTLQKRLIVAVTLSASFLSVLTQFLLLTAFPKIMEEFSINSTQVQRLTTRSMLTIAILSLFTAYFIVTSKVRR